MKEVFANGLNLCQNPQNPQFGAIFFDFLGVFQKLGSISFLIFWLSNFQQKIGKKWWGNPEILRRERKDKLANRAKFIGYFP